MSKDYAEITALMSHYFDGLYHADSQVLRRVFHPNLAYICATEGDELYLDLDSYMARIDTREAPAKRREVRKEQVLSITVGNPRLAHVTARMEMMGRAYLDELTLIRLGSDWRVATKVFTYLPSGV